ncbi:hypothetical protein H0H93_007042 [Arthromyces matolae]|nr:hypothetical protein H0H93_007042 [Arthromyces matolae]
MASPDDDKSSSRLNQRQKRVWLILAAFLFIITFVHYVLPSSSSYTRPRQQHQYSQNLKPKNYFNTSETDPNPFDFCPVYAPQDQLTLKYGNQALSKIAMHAGSGERIQRVINRALAGQPVTISIIGGSVSACHGAGDDPIAPNCYPARFFEWWNSVFPHPATELTNGAMRRTNSGYFGFCSAHHIPDITDIVIIELDSDDTTDHDMLENFETLVRSILIRPDSPAVLLLGHFNPQTHAIHGFAGPDHTHDIVAQFYDVPHLSSKSLLFPSYLKDPKSISQYFVDPVLAGPKGHEVLADVLIAYLQSQICHVWSTQQPYLFESSSGSSTGGNSPSDAKGLFGGIGQRPGVPEPGTKDPSLDADGNANLKPPGAAAGEVKQRATQSQYALSPIPQGRINTRPGGRSFEEIAPYCISANDLINPLPPSMFYGSGWNVYHASSSSLGIEGGHLRTTSHYWYSTLPTSKLRVPIQVGSGDIGVYYLVEPISKVGEGSAVECWVDDNYGGAKLLENAEDVGEEMPKLVVIDHFVGRGSHFVECVLLGEEGEGVPMFKILGVFAT